MASSYYDPDLLHRSTYLAREYRILAAMKDELQGIILAPSEGPFQVPNGHNTNHAEAGGGVGGSVGDTTARWKGIIFIRLKESPWHKGAFGFTIEFPLKYPFECPIATFDHPGISSHPLLKNGTEVQFQAEYTSINPMQVSVLVRLIKFIRRLFSAQCPSINTVDLGRAKWDVSRSPIAGTMVDQHSAYFTEILVGDQVLTEMQRRHASVKAAAEAAAEENTGVENNHRSKVQDFGTWFASFFTSKYLPQTRALAR